MCIIHLLSFPCVFSRVSQKNAITDHQVSGTGVYRINLQKSNGVVYFS